MGSKIGGQQLINFFVTFDLKDTAVFMYNAAIHRYIFLRGMVLEK